MIRPRTLVVPVDRAIGALAAFMRLEAAGGLLLMGAAVLALVLANSPAGNAYSTFLGTYLQISFGDFGIAKPLLLWINDGLMAVFFLLVGLELKREMLEGHLSSWRSASLAAWAALGGMLVPAALYLAFNWNDPVARQGWAIPAATDIAFALGIMLLLGNRVPAALKALLLSVAIFDDLGAIVIIAVFYTASLSWTALAIALVLLGTLVVLNRAGVMRIAPYMIVGVGLWVAVLKSGVHATLAGVATALAIPLRGTVSEVGAETPSPLHELESSLHPWVAYGILPVFAFANAGVPVLDLAFSDVLHPITLGIALGLLLGKQLGVGLSAYAAVRLGAASLPPGIRWSEVYATAVLCGIGFTMSLFIASLAFPPEQTAAGLDRLGILLGSLLSGLLGYVLLRRSLRYRQGVTSEPQSRSQ